MIYHSQLSKQASDRNLDSSGSTLTGLLIVLSVFTSSPLFGLTLPEWAQPSFVGVIWGGLFLAGFGLATLATSSMIHLLAMPSCALVLTFAFRNVTDLTMEECLVASVVLISTGWVARRFDAKVLNLTRGEQGNEPEKWQLPIMDLFVVTTLTACVSRALIHMNQPPIMLISVLGTLLVGCGCCWAAYHWTWNDSRPVGIPLVSVILLALIGISILLRVSPMTAMELAGWLLIGPLSVLAAQSFTVLAIFAAIRWQSHSLIAAR